MNYKYLFGPVPSRRLGVSLGVDLVPHKVCSLDCLYCEIGKTTDLTVKRKEYVPTDEVIKELKNYLSTKPDLDYITFSGQGEPTLNSGIGKIISFIKSEFPEYKLALITNSTLLYNKELREEILPVDLILPSMDAVSIQTFKKINRPASDMDVKHKLDGLLKFSKEYKGEMWLEIFIIQKINDSEEEISKMKKIVTELNPTKIQLNSLDRPGTESWVEKASLEKLKEIQQKFKPLNAKIIAKYKNRKKIESFDQSIKEKIINTVNRRPCTKEDLSEILNIKIQELNKYLSELINDKKIIEEKKDRGIFFKKNTETK